MRSGFSRSLANETAIALSPVARRLASCIWASSSIVRCENQVATTTATATTTEVVRISFAEIEIPVRAWVVAALT